MPDRTIVIGGGLAGSLAALAAAATGEAIVIRAAPGSTGMSPAVFDLLPYSDLAARAGNDAVTGIPDLELLALVRRHLPHHPLAGEGWYEAALSGARLLISALASEGLVYADPVPTAIPLASAGGQVALTSLVPAHFADGNLASLGSRTVGVLVVESAWPPGPETAGLLAEAAAFLPRPPRFVPVTVNLGDDSAPYDLARLTWWLEREGMVQLADRLTPQLADIDALAVPSVLGRGPGLEPLADLAQRLGRPVFEMPSPPPSLSGFRLAVALDAALARAGVQVLTGRCRRFSASGDRVTEVDFESPDGRSARDSRAAGDRFILAGGRFLGGGLQRWPHLAESLFDLPVWIDGRPAAERTLDQLTSSRPLEPEPIFRAGVRVDGSSRPLGVDGGPAFSNLFAAGSILAGASAGGGGGVALSSAWIAGAAAGALA